MPIVAITDVSFQSLLTLIGTMFTAYVAYLMAKMNHDQKIRAEDVAVEVKEVKETLQANADKAADKVTEVKETLQQSADKAAITMETLAKEETLQKLQAHTEADLGKLDGLARVAHANQVTTEKVHVLVNSAMSIQLHLNAVAMRRIAELTGHADDATAATLAEDAYRAHQAQQEIVDQGKTVA